jgi:hypothetical protein
MNVSWQDIITVLALIGAILAWVAKLRWSKEFAAAKDEALKAKNEQVTTLEKTVSSLQTTQEQTIRAKDAEIAALQREVQTYQNLTPMKLREYTESMKQMFEEMASMLQEQLNQAQLRIKDLTAKIDQLEAAHDTQAAELEELKAIRVQLEERTHALTNQLDEFKRYYDKSDILIRVPRIDYTPLTGAAIEIQGAITAAVRALARDPWVQALARENMKRKSPKVLPQAAEGATSEHGNPPDETPPRER